MYGISPTYRRNLRANLALAGLDNAQVRRAAIAHAGQMLAETPALWLRPQAEVAALVREVHGLDPALAARAQGKALLFLTPHMGCFEIAAQYAAQRIPMTVLYRAPKIAWLDPLMREGRSRGSVRLAPADFRGVRDVLAALKRREAAGFLPDQVPGVGDRRPAHARVVDPGEREIGAQVAAVGGRYPIHRPPEDGSQQMQHRQRQACDQTEENPGEAVQVLVSLRPST